MSALIKFAAAAVSVTTISAVFGGGFVAAVLSGLTVAFIATR